MAKRLQRKVSAPAGKFLELQLFGFDFAPLAATWREWLPKVLLIAALTLVAYWPALNGAFIWDDGWYITTNTMLRDVHGLWKFWFSPGSWVEYYPIEETVLWMQYQLFGENPLGYHLTNVALHIVSALLVWNVLAKLGLRLAWIGGLIFAVHPVQVESVAWIAELKNTLCLPFFLLAIGSWIDYENRHEARDYRRALGWFVVAMLCKIAVAPMPFLILLFAWWKRSRISFADVKAAAPFLVVALGLGFLSWSSGQAYEHRAHAQELSTSLGDPLTQTLRAAMILSFYAVSWLVPFDLAPIYPKWPTSPASLLDWLPLVAWIGLVAWAWTRRAGWGRHLLLGLGFFVLLLGPFLGFHFVSYMLDSWVELHLLYIPALGPIALIVAVLGGIYQRVPATLRWPANGALAVAILALVFGARAYAFWFVDEETFWTRTLHRYPTAWLPHHDLGCTMLDQKRYPEALALLQTAARILPEFGDGHMNVGLALDKLGRTQEAEVEFREALRLNPRSANACLNLGEQLRRQGKIADAENLFAEGLKNSPDSAALMIDLGGLYYQTGRTAEAVALYQRAAETAPEIAGVQYNLGSALLDAGDLNGAVAHLSRAVDLDPKLAAAHASLGTALARTHRLEDAITQFRLALDADPQLRDARDNLGLALAQTGRIPEALEQFKLSLLQHPDDAKAKESAEKLEQFLKQQSGGK